MHIFRHKFISILFALGQKKMSLKSDQLEVSGSVYIMKVLLYSENVMVKKLYSENVMVKNKR